MLFVVLLAGIVVGIVIMGVIVRSFMPSMMFARYKSRFNFEETVSALTESAQKCGWNIPEIRDLQQDYKEAGLEDMKKVKILYFCNPQGGYRILQNDTHKPMSVMMPMGVSVYETNEGQVYIAGMNLGTMSMMFSGVVKQVLQEGSANFRKSIESLIAK